MKKSILALSVLAVAGGLGLAGSAQAVVFLSQQGVDATTPVGQYMFQPTWYTTMNTGNAAVGLELNPGSTGHELVVPYYTAQGGSATMINIVNTDTVNGKAVKVRFRGAANSDDVLDFTLLMSPGDVWNGTVLQETNGLATLLSNDGSCTIPKNTNFRPSKAAGLVGGANFITIRFPDYLTDPQKAANTREGYVEILNMADIPPYTFGDRDNLPTQHASTWTTNDLYAAIKHTPEGDPPTCQSGLWKSGSNNGQSALNVLVDTNGSADGVDLLNNYGLAAPSGGLTGGWMILNQNTLAQFSGNDTAVRAYRDPDVGASTPDRGHSGTAWVAFSPQYQDDYRGGAAAAALVTADPLLTGSAGNEASVPAQWFDFPDLSTPLGIRDTGATPIAVGTHVLDLPTPHVETLARALAKTAVHDEFYNNPASTELTTNTDWVLSQATRRYFAVLDYATKSADASILYNDNVTSGTAQYPTWGTASLLPYAGNGAIRPLPTSGFIWHGPSDFWLNTAWKPSLGAGILRVLAQPNGPQACLNGRAKFWNQEEVTSTSASFSPGLSAPTFCGEVATMTWNNGADKGTSALNASLTNTQATSDYPAGWATFSLLPTSLGTGPNVNPGYGLPVTGFAAITFKGNAQSYGASWPLRWGDNH